MSEEDTPKKRKAKTRKKDLTSLTAGNSAVNILPPQLEDALKDALLRFNDFPDIRKYKLRDLQHLDNIAQEFLKAFVILGYDLTGEKVHIFHATCPHDKDALVEHLRTTLINIVSNNNNGEDN